VQFISRVSFLFHISGKNGVDLIKDTLIQGRDNGVYPGLAYVAQKNAALIPNEDMMEAVAAFLEKRKPIFKGR